MPLRQIKAWGILDVQHRGLRRKHRQAGPVQTYKTKPAAQKAIGRKFGLEPVEVYILYYIPERDTT